MPVLGLHELAHTLHLLIAYKIINDLFFAGHVHSELICIVVHLCMVIVVNYVRLASSYWIERVILYFHATILHIDSARLDATYIKTGHTRHGISLDAIVI